MAGSSLTLLELSREGRGDSAATSTTGQSHLQPHLLTGSGAATLGTPLQHKDVPWLWATFAQRDIRAAGSVTLQPPGGNGVHLGTPPKRTPGLISVGAAPIPSFSSCQLPAPSMERGSHAPSLLLSPARWAGGGQQPPSPGRWHGQPAHVALCHSRLGPAACKAPTKGRMCPQHSSGTRAKPGHPPVVQSHSRGGQWGQVPALMCPEHCEIPNTGFTQTTWRCQQ